MVDRKADVEFLNSYLQELQEGYAIGQEITPVNIPPSGGPPPCPPYPADIPPFDDTPPCPPPSGGPPQISDDAERAATLADKHGFDGNCFRNLHSRSSEYCFVGVQ
jgi:hypothetical protein